MKDYVLIIKQGNDLKKWVKLMELTYFNDRELHTYLENNIFELIEDKDNEIKYKELKR